MPSDHPNVLWLFTDQQRFDTIAALGNPVIRTPNLDRLCRQGVAFRSAYTPSPVCVPARASMHYGQYPCHTGCYENDYPMPTDGRPSVMDALVEAGYYTHAIGKRHFRPDRHAGRGFQVLQRQEENISPDQDDYLQFLFAEGFDHLTDPHGVRSEMYYVPQPAQMPARLHPTQWVGDQAVRLIGERAGSAQPWLAFVSFIHPHPPFSPPVPWHKLYRAPQMPLPNVPPDSEALWTWVNRNQNRYKYRDQGVDWNLVRCIKAYYYAAVSFVDYQIGRALDALEATGQADNTLVLFTSDHGEHLGDRYCFGKRTMHDSASRVPLLLRLPGRFEGGRTCDRPVSLVDIAPTLLAACGAEMPSDQLDGIDLAEALAGQCEREMVFSQHAQGPLATYMAADDRWKYVYSAGDGREMLFDRVADPLETRDRIGAPFSREPHARMKEALIDHLRRGGETAALDGDDWRSYPRREMPANPDAGLLVQDMKWADTSIPGYTD